MGVEDYTVRYIADPSAFLANARQVEAIVVSLDAKAVGLKKEMSGLLAQVGRSATSAAGNVDKLNAALGQSAGTMTNSRASMQGLDAAANGAARSTGDLSGNLAKFLTLGAGIQLVANALQAVAKASEDAKKHLNQGRRRASTCGGRPASTPTSWASPASTTTR